MELPQVTLCYVVKEGRVLLIHKLRGLGAGKINGPGGKVEPGETPLAAAVRETQEETGVTPLDPKLLGELRFNFDDGHATQCLIFRADNYAGSPRDTPEALPAWYPVHDLPYDRMWDDDRHWLPMLLASERFAGTVAITQGTASAPQWTEIINE